VSSAPNVTWTPCWIAISDIQPSYLWMIAKRIHEGPLDVSVNEVDEDLPRAS
jgi:hypothetical protein